MTLFPDALAARKVTNCAICGRPLSDPESQRRGLGPVCAPPPPKPPRPVADQPALPGMGRAPTELEQDAPDAPDPAKDSTEEQRRQDGAVACQRASCVILRFRGIEIRHEVVDEDDETAIGRAVEAWMSTAGGRVR